MSPWMWALAVAVGAVTGVLSGWGIGGGTLLVLYLTMALDTPQRVAQGINLLYFLCAALPAAVSHVKAGRVDKRGAAWAAGAGMAAAALAAWLTYQMDVGILRRLFGVLLLWVGCKTLFKKPRRDAGAGNPDSSPE